MYLTILSAFVAVSSVYCNDMSSRQWLEALSWETRDILLHLQPQLGVKILTDPPIPLYRPDLGERIAYWLISYNYHWYAILSAGQHTRDNMLIMQGDNPSPLVALQLRAMEANCTCLRYLVMTPSPDLNMACDTEYGRLLERTFDLENVTSLWEEMKDSDDVDQGKELGMPNPEDNTTIHLHIISSSQPATFPLTGIQDCHIRSLGQSNGSDVSVQTLCKLLKICDQEGRVHVHRQTEYGEVYVHLEPVLNDQHQKFDHDLHFEVVGTNRDNSIIAKGFALESSHRTKRQLSPYTYYGITESSLMPDYNQFKHGKCQVGCGPVAWAQIFGYYDRRAHLGKGRLPSKALYRCGKDGTTGSNACTAPKYNDARMKNYIVKLKGILRTFCVLGQGATLQTNMDDIAGFYRARQGRSGNIELRKHGFIFNQLVGPYSASIRNSALTYIRQKWPVIVGFRVSGIFSQHYAVMTSYRTRTVRKKVCTLIIFCKTRTVREYDMYLHMGWGGKSNGWRKAEMFMAAVAKY